MAFTYFFRDLHSLEHAASQVVQDFSGSARIRVWDAGCANGPEPYSLAIVFSTKLGKFGFKNLHIDATDHDGSSLFGDIIAAGVYSDEELGRIPHETLGKYFHKSSQTGHLEIDDTIKPRVRFQRHDLLSLQEIGNGYHLVMCKNVLLHFSPEERINVIRMFHRALVKGGYLVMEQTQKLPEELTSLFEQVTPDAQLYRKT